MKSVKGKMPVRYRVHPLQRYPGILFTLLIILGILYFLFTKVNLDSPNFIKVISLVVLYIGLDQFFRHVSSLNEVIFTQECLWLRFVLKSPIPILWENIKSLQLNKRITYYVYIGYVDTNGKLQTYKTPASFPKMLEILYNISELAPGIPMNDKLRKMLELLKDISQSSQEDKNEL